MKYTDRDLRVVGSKGFSSRMASLKRKLFKVIAHQLPTFA